MSTKNNDIISQNKVYLWLAIATGLLLSIPLIAMQFSEEVQWTLADFILMGVLIYGFGFIFVQLARFAPKKYRLPIAAVVGLIFLWLWAELAVGVFTNIGS